VKVFYKEWIPFIGTLFFFVFGCNGLVQLYREIRITSRRLAAPTNDINTTVALALLTSFASMQV
jgi:F-type H+-transporting ATPase subunit a